MINGSVNDKIKFALLKSSGKDEEGHFIISAKGDRRTHFEWLSSQYIGWDHFRNLDMGYFFEGDDTIYIFHGNQYQPIEKVNDILSIVRRLIDKLGMDSTKTYHVINGIKSDESSITKISVNLSGSSNI